MNDLLIWWFYVEQVNVENNQSIKSKIDTWMLTCTTITCDSMGCSEEEISIHTFFSVCQNGAKHSNFIRCSENLINNFGKMIT